MLDSLIVYRNGADPKLLLQRGDPVIVELYAKDDITGGTNKVYVMGTFVEYYPNGYYEGLKGREKMKYDRAQVKLMNNGQLTMISLKYIWVT